MGLFKTWKEIMFNPVEFFEKMPKKIGYREPTKFFLKMQAIMTGIFYFIALLVALAMMLIFGAIGGMVGQISAGIIGIVALIALLLFPLILLFSWGGLYVSAGITHIMVRLFGGKEPFVETFKVNAYSIAPMVFCFIPILNWAAYIYIIILQVLGIQKRQKLSLGKSVAVILIPIAVISLIVIIFYFMFVFSAIFGSLAADSALSAAGGLP